MITKVKTIVPQYNKKLNKIHYVDVTQKKQKFWSTSKSISQKVTITGIFIELKNCKILSVSIV